MKGIKIEKKDNIATLWIDNPETRNALSVPIVEYIDDLMDEVIEDKDIRALVITGGGEKTFVSGADINKLIEMTPEEARYSIEVGHALFTKIETMDIPVVSAINGYCLGGGLEIAMSCDIRVASKNAKFGLPEIGIGMIPGWGGTLRLQRIIGQGRAKNMVLRGHMISSEEALDYGLITEVYEDVESMRDGAIKIAEELASRAPITMKTDLRLFYDAANQQPEDIAQRDALALGYIHTTEDAKEGLRAFLEKRDPEYKGR